jgi:TolB-like protein
MTHFPLYPLRVLGALASLALPAIAAAQADTRPIVAILPFDNNSIGAGRQDFDGIGKGIQETLIADMAANTKVRLVDRERVQRILEEQNLVKSGSIDPGTAVRVGRILGAQYAIYGGFMSDGRGSMVLTAHSTDMETSALANAVRVQHNTDDVLGLIGEMTAKLNSEMKLEPKPGRRGASTEAGATKTPAATAPPSGAASETTTAAPPQSATAASPKTPQIETFAKPVSPKVMKTKLDIATMRIYSNALDEIDRKNPARAAQLLRQVLAKFPNFEPAQRNLEKLTRKPRS